MKFYIVRHGDREKGDFYNETLRHQDNPLTPEGHSKAQELVDYFKDIPIKKILVSHYLRTMQTAQYIAAYKGLAPLKDARLNEIDNGVIERMSLEEITERYPEFWNDFKSYSKDVRFPEGETGEEVKARQKSLLDELLKSGEDVLMFSHEGYMRLLMCHLLGIPVYRRHQFKVDFCGIMEFEFDDKANCWKVIRFNQTY